MDKSISEAGMPSSVARHKQNIANMSDKEFAQKYSHLDDKGLKSMAWSHLGTKRGGPGTPGHSHYVNRMAKGKAELAKETNEEYDLDERTLSTGEMKQRENIVKSMKKSYGDFRKRYGEKAKSVMYATATKMAKEDIDQEEDLEDMHYCAKHVYSDMFGEGVVVEGEHAEPDEDGNIAWYVVEFKDGLRKIPTDKLDIMMAEYHMNHKKKKKMMEDEELDEMSSKMKMKLGLYGKKKKMMEEDDLEEQEGGVPKTSAHKKLAGHYGDPNRITRGDIITAAKKNAKAKGM